MSGKRTAYAAVAIAVALFPAVAHSKPIEDHKWIEVRTENFVIHSVESKRHTKRIARNLEMMRAAIPEPLLRLRKPPSEPKVIYAFDYPAQLEEIGYTDSEIIDFEHGEYAFWAPYPSTNPDLGFLRVYAQYLVHDGAYLPDSYWYVTGIRYYFHSARIRNGMFRFGWWRKQQREDPAVLQQGVEFALSDRDFATLPWDERVRAGAYGWLVIRFLTDSQDDWHDFGNKLADYRRSIELGHSIEDSFEGAFGYELSSLGEAMAEFSATCCEEFVIPVEELLLDFEPQVRELSREEVSLGLGSVAARLGARDRAREFFEIALGGDATRAAAQAGIDGLGAAPQPAEAEN